MMKAAIYERYGQHEVLKLRDIEKPTPQDGEVLIKLRAASINASDWEALTGSPFYVRIIGGLLKPKGKILGSDIAGVIESVGSNVSGFKQRDAVVGETLYRGGRGFAEYICVSEKALNHKSAKLTFEQAAALPQAAVLALQALHDTKPTQPGDQLLINGAGGGAGSFAIQLAKMMGAEVTGVDSDIKFELMRSLGADHVIDYRTTDYTKTGLQYDRIVDFVATHSPTAYRRALKPNGVFLLVGGGVWPLLRVVIGSQLSKQSDKMTKLLAWQHKTSDLAKIQAFCESGKLTPIIDKCYPLDDIQEAFRYFGTKQAKGKIVIQIS